MKKKLTALWQEEFARLGHCCLCGNSGIINTRNKVFTAAGFHCGDIAFCICPNGRAYKKQDPAAITAMRVNPETGGE